MSLRNVCLLTAAGWSGRARVEKGSKGAGGQPTHEVAQSSDQTSDHPLSVSLPAGPGSQEDE